MTESLNPYAAPRSDTAPDPASSSRRTAWKVYAYGVVAVQVAGLFFALRKISVAEVLDYAVTAVGIVGLFGYAYRRAFWRRRLWMLWGVLFPVWDVVMGLWVYPKQDGTSVRIAYFVAMLLFLPQYLAVIRYAYGSRELWREAQARMSNREDR